MDRNSVKDIHIDYILRKFWIPPQDFIQGQVTGASTVLTTGIAGVVGTYEQLASSGVGAVKLAATTTNIDVSVKLPGDMDPRHRLFIRHRWTSDYATANGTAQFLTLYTAQVDGGVHAAAATALSSVIGNATKVSATARATYWTPMGWINGNVLAHNTEFLTMRTSVSGVTGITIASDFVWFLGTELLYTPRNTFGDGSLREARQLMANLSYQEAGPLVDV